jgi:predicted RNA-binding Zn-ribbon protein involved in translation (DUF1610 family)
MTVELKMNDVTYPCPNCGEILDINEKDHCYRCGKQVCHNCGYFSMMYVEKGFDLYETCCHNCWQAGVDAGEIVDW